jgi:hypothetical protein
VRRSQNVIERVFGQRGTPSSANEQVFGVYVPIEIAEASWV